MKTTLTETQDPSTARIGLDPADVTDAVEQAVRRIAPLWPLKNFVAVNPYLGLADHDFDGAARRMASVAGARPTLPRDFYAQAIRSGRITRPSLEDALEAAHARAADHPEVRDLLPDDADDFMVRVLETPEMDPAPGSELGSGPDRPPEPVPTIASLAEEITGQVWQEWVRDRISAWAGGHLDEEQAAWQSPWANESVWTSWREETRIDRTPDVMGLAGFRDFVDGLPEDAGEAIQLLLHELGLPGESVEIYLHRLLMATGGWAALLRQYLWEAELREGTDRGIYDLVAVVLAWEAGLLRHLDAPGLADRWAAVRDQLGVWPDLSRTATAMQLDLVLQDAFERSWQDDWVRRFDEVAQARDGARDAAGDRAHAEAPGGTDRPAVQAAFCIDVRSEIYRRALERHDPTVETIGFAGFFGFPLEVVPLGAEMGGSQCPVLLTPSHTVAETAGDAGETARLGRLRALHRTARDVWMSFKMGAVSCFGFVGPVGLAYAWKLVQNGFGLKRPESHPSTFGVLKSDRARLGPDVGPDHRGDRILGMTPADRIDVAEGVLGAMSLNNRLGRVVVLAGHGSTTANNPHATGLDCGACGGHTGEANARVAATVLNDAVVRAGLRERGIAVPGDTVFIAGLHDTTTDEVTLFDGHVPDSHRAEVARLKESLAAAARTARAERAPLLGLSDAGDVDAAIDGRTRDWSQVRPEWGLAGCAAFVAAPRERTADLDLGGRSFLHSYRWQEDEDFGVLELIMTAPMVVASWISLQYYGSTVDNRVFGCGNKTLHNVVGVLGVLEGNAGELRTGLPWQSVHDGERFIHEPVRLNVAIEAPREAMNAILEKHDDVRGLLDNGWLNLWAMDETGAISHRYTGDLQWAQVEVAPAGEEKSGAEQAA